MCVGSSALITGAAGDLDNPKELDVGIPNAAAAEAIKLGQGGPGASCRYPVVAPPSFRIQLPRHHTVIHTGSH
jgi:hypothetical protein